MASTAAAGVRGDTLDGVADASLLSLRRALARGDIPAFTAALAECAALPDVLGASLDVEYNTLLHAAAASPHGAPFVAAMLGAGAAVDPPNKHTKRPLLCAAAAGCMEAVKALLAAGADPTAPAKNGWTALMAAAVRGHVGIAAHLVAHVGGGATAAAAAAAAAFVNARNKEGATALYLAAREVEEAEAVTAMLRLLVSAGAEVNSRCANGRTAVLAAASAGRPAALRCLVEELGADVTARDSGGFNLLHALAEAHDEGEGDGGAAAGAGDGRTPDTAATETVPAASTAAVPAHVEGHGCGACIAYVFGGGGGGAAACGTDSGGVAGGWRRQLLAMLHDDRDTCGRTPLHIAAARGNAAFLAAALRWSGPSAAPATGAAVPPLVDAVDTRGCTALYYAVAGGHRAAARVLLASGADATASTPQRSILHVAAMWDRAQLLDALCESVASRGGAAAVAAALAAVDCEGRSVAAVAAAHGRALAASRVIAWLERCG